MITNQDCGPAEQGPTNLDRGCCQTPTWSSQTIKFKDLGLTPYREAWEIQKSAQKALIDGSNEQIIILCQHPPVITLGTSSSIENLLASEESLKENGIEVIKIERGGDITYHGPGQLVIYPILDLKRFKPDVGWYMRALEESIILTLKEYGVSGARINGRTGVWLEKKDQNEIDTKIASMGVRISRWCTMHGAAINVYEEEPGFSLINPCGFKDVRMASIESLTENRPTFKEVGEILKKNVCSVFGVC